MVRFLKYSTSNMPSPCKPDYGLDKSLKMSQFERVYITSYWRSIVNMALSRVVSEIFNVENIGTLKSRSRVNQGHWKWYHLIVWIWFPINFYSKFVRKTHRFLPRDAMRKRSLWCGPVSVCLSVRLSVTFVHSIQMAEDIIKLLCRPGSPIILVFDPPAPIPNSKGNLGPISYSFRDRRLFQSKIANFSHRFVLSAPAEGVLLRIGYRCWESKN